jgi:hypothetical protein
MGNSTARLDPLVVAEGQPARARGFLLTLESGPVLVTDGGSVTMRGEVAESASFAVPILIPTPEAISGMGTGLPDGPEITAFGHWREGHLELRRTVPSADPDHVVTRVDFHDGPRRHRLADHPLPPRRTDEEREQLREGTLMAFWTDHGRKRALVDDLDAASARIPQVLGEDVELVQSRWSQATIDAMMAVFLADDASVASFGYTQAAGDQLQVTATLVRLSAEMAAELAGFPPDALRLNVMVTPET